MPPRRRAGLVRAQGGLAEHGNAGRSPLRHPAAHRGRHPDDDDHRARHGEGDHGASPSGRGGGAEAAQGGNSMIELARRMSCVQAAAIREILKVTERPDVLSFAGGLPAPEAFPAGALARAHADVLANDAAAALQYGPTEGFGPLRAWVAERMMRRGLPAVPGQVLITAGSQQGIDLVGKALIDPGDTVVVEAPSYLAALQSFSTYEARFETVASDDEGMQVDALERVLRRKRAKLVYLVPTFQNPRGTTLSLERRARLARLSAECGVTVLEDDPYGELRYRGAALPPVAGIERDAPVIHLGSFSKTLAPGLRLGYAVADARTIRALTIAKQAADL